MNKAYLLINNIYLPHTKVFRYFTLYFIGIICVVFGAGIFSAAILSRYVAYHQPQLLMVCLLLGETVYLFEALHRYKQKGERTLLVKLGFSNVELLLVHFFKLRINYIIFAMLYSALAFYQNGRMSLFYCTLYFFVSFGVFIVLVCFSAACPFLFYRIGLASKPMLASIPVVGGAMRSTQYPKRHEIMPSQKRPLQCFIVRDAKHMANQAIFIAMQGLFAFVIAAFIYYGNSYGIKIAMIVTVVFGSLSTQNLFYLDSQYIPIYRKVPLSFNRFFMYRIASASIIALVLPNLMLVIALAFRRVAFADYVLFLLISIGIAIVFAIYFSCIILCFFPKVEKTDIPMAVGLFLPFLMIVMIPFGISKGRANWRRWEFYAPDK